MDKEPLHDYNDESNLSAHLHQETHSPLLSSQIPSLKLKKTLMLPTTSDSQNHPKPGIRTVRARLSLSKKLSIIPQDILNAKNPHHSGQLPSGHHRSESETHPHPPAAKKGELTPSRPKKETGGEMTLKSAVEKPYALKELLKPPVIHRRAPSGSISMMPKSGTSTYSLAGNSELGNKTVNQKSMKEQSREFQDISANYKCLDAIKGAVFSDNRNKFGAYQKKFFAMKEKGSNLETLFTPKTNCRNHDSLPRQTTKTPFSAELQLLKEALGQHIPAHLQGEPTGSNSAKQIVRSSEKRERPGNVSRTLHSTSGQSQKRERSGERNSLVINCSGEKESPLKKESLMLMEHLISRNMSGKEVQNKVTREEIKPEKMKNERAKAAEEELQYFKEFLEVEKQTFDFEKTIAAQRNSAKAGKGKKDSMYIAVASPSSRKEQHESNRKQQEKGSEGETIGQYFLYAKEISDTSKNGQGSTTCSSSKLMKEMSPAKKEDKLSYGFGEAVKVIEGERKKSRIVRKGSCKQE